MSHHEKVHTRLSRDMKGRTKKPVASSTVEVIPPQHHGLSTAAQPSQQHLLQSQETQQTKLTLALVSGIIMEQAPVQIGQFILGKNLGIGAFGKVRSLSLDTAIQACPRSLTSKKIPKATAITTCTCSAYGYVGFLTLL
jgi:hypothetical protein